MKTLYVLRHAKSSWNDESLSDFERPLNERGKKAAPFMGEFMKKNDFAPDLIISSPAERAKQTAELVKKAANFAAEIRFNEKIYEASPLRLLEVVSEADANAKTLMLVGHNPGFEGLVRVLAGENARMPTAALAVLDLEINDWSEIYDECIALEEIEVCGKLRTLILPKEEM